MRIFCVSVGRAATEEIASEHERVLAAMSGPGVEIVSRGRVATEAEAQSVAGAAAQSEADVLVLVTLCGRTAPILEALAKATPLPCVIWALGRDFAFPSSALAAGALQEAHKPVTLIHGSPTDPETIEEFLKAARAAYALNRLSRARIGVIGGLFPNLVSCRYDAGRIRDRLGAKLVPLETEELRGKMREAEDTALDELRELCRSHDLRAPAESLTKGLRLHLALKRLAEEKSLDAFAVECWTGLPEAIGLNPCLGFLEDVYVLACEGDVMLAISLLIARYVTGASACAADARDLSRDNVLTLCHCGGPAFAAADGDVILDRSPQAERGGFPTVTCRPRLATGPVTLVRLYGTDCDRMHVAAGDLLSCDRSQDMAVTVRLRGKRQHFIDQCLGNHYVIVPGDIRDSLAVLGEWLGIAINCT